MSWGRRWSAITAVFVIVFSSLTVVAHAEDSGTTSSGNKIVVTVTGAPIANIASNPLALTPTFGRGIVDYVWRCQSGTNALQVTLTAIPGGVLHIGDQRGSTLTIQENLLENQALVITGPWSRGFAIASGVRQSREERSDEARGHTEYWIRCLPHDFPQLGVQRTGAVPAGWYLTANISGVRGSWPYLMVLDTNGTPVWYQKSIGPHALNLTELSPTTLAWGTNAGPGFGADPSGAFQVFNLATRVSQQMSAPVPPIDFHELLPLANGTYMMLSTPLRNDVDLNALGLGASNSIVDCVVQEVGPGGSLLWQWRASEHLSPQESTHPFLAQWNGQRAYDLFHCNSIDVDLQTGSILISCRHTDAVYLVNRLTGKVTWKMGGTPSNLDGAQILRIQNDPDGAFHAQHDARFRPSGDISLYDNQSWNPGMAARGVEYRVDQASGTATLVWSYSSSDGRNASATGSFRRLYGGTDNVIGWGFKSHQLLTEVDQDGNVLLNVTFPTGELAYRAVKVTVDSLNHALLRASAGMFSS